MIWDAALSASHSLLLTTGSYRCPLRRSGQAPSAASDPDIPISHQDRVYSAEQVFDSCLRHRPIWRQLALGTVPALAIRSPAPRQSALQGPGVGARHGFSGPTITPLPVVAIGSNAVNLIDTATNGVKHVTPTSGALPMSVLWGGWQWRFGSSFAARTTSPYWTAQPTRRRHGLPRSKRPGHDDLLPRR